MSWIKVGRWVFQVEDVVALENRVDGVEVKLKGVHGVRLNKAECKAFLRRFETNAVVEDLGVVQDSISRSSE
jgi:hypothetical protein